MESEMEDFIIQSTGVMHLILLVLILIFVVLFLMLNVVKKIRGELQFTVSPSVATMAEDVDQRLQYRFEDLGERLEKRIDFPRARVSDLLDYLGDINYAVKSCSDNLSLIDDMLTHLVYPNSAEDLTKS
jgi:hypothetical protein